MNSQGYDDEMETPDISNIKKMEIKILFTESLSFSKALTELSAKC